LQKSANLKVNPIDTRSELASIAGVSHDTIAGVYPIIHCRSLSDNPLPELIHDFSRELKFSMAINIQKKSCSAKNCGTRKPMSYRR